VNSAVSQANQYTDSRLAELDNDVWTMERNYRGATSSAMAMAGLPQAYLPGKSMLSVGFGGYQGEYGMAFGLSGITENGRYVYKASASGNTSRDWGFSVGAGIQW
ncbi:MAG TPA: YadA-like family protein, partial [Pseudoxanthomonas sp.]|nr:YadA-like family protein [Pseudoxanthomonas sp.]